MSYANFICPVFLQYTVPIKKNLSPTEYDTVALKWSHSELSNICIKRSNTKDKIQK